MRSSNDLYIATITPLVWIPVYHPPPPTLYGFIVNGSGYAFLYDQSNYPHTCQTPVYRSSSYFSRENLQRRRRKILNSKPYLRVVVMKGVVMVPNCVNISFTAGYTNLPPLNMPPCSCLQLGKFFGCFCRISFKIYCSKFTSPFIYITV